MLLKMAFRNLFRQRRRSLLTGLSMGGGYMLFVFSMSLLEGSWGNIVDIFTGDRVGHIQIHQLDYRATPKAHRVIKDTNRLEKFLSEQKDVRSYAPRIFSAGLAYATDKSYPPQLSVSMFWPSQPSRVYAIKSRPERILPQALIQKATMRR